MKAHELFGVIVRSIGFFILVLGLLIAVRMVIPIEGINHWEYLQSISALCGLGLICLFGADRIVRAAYRTREVKSIADR